ncbi:MAG: phosphoribosylformylglycinamidine synthase subunit PurL [Planctomycetes bacterium]|nr:phosphoribosylformylglycinamidine synthase subunit PurL [Planctomycetota bacterium]
MSPQTVPQPATASSTQAAFPRAWRVEVYRRPELDDPEGARAAGALRELGLAQARDIRLGRGYLLSPELDAAVVAGIASDLLVDPVLESARITPPTQAPTPSSAAHRVLVMRRPGVMDPVAATVERAIQRSGLSGAGGAPVRALCFSVWELQGSWTRAELELAAAKTLANDVIDEVRIDDERLHFQLPGAGATRALERIALRDANDATLEHISRAGHLSLTLLEMQAIRAHFADLGRDPTSAELETLAQTWSEHCKHKTFAGVIDYDGERIENLLKQTIKAATLELALPWCVSVFHDNAGVVEFDAGWHVAIKVETHNHPSAIDPYGGAGTGVGGVIRDILGVGLGAKPIANTDAFFVGPLDLPVASVPKGCMHPRRILRGVVAGVRDYGNRMGIPTVNGGVWVDPRYVGNPLVFCGTVGLLPADCASKAVHPGDVIVVVGGRTGRDGIHGATFSSAELHDESVVVSSSAVQIGNAITEKRVLDALLRARDAQLYRGVTDCGAGGLSSAVGEMGAECGAEVHLERVPLKYPGLSAAEIWISEAQERMVLAVPPEKLERLLQLFAEEDCEASAIGHFTSTGKLTLHFGAECVGELDMHFLHEGTPKWLRKATRPVVVHDDPACPPCADATAVLLRLLSSPNIASKEWIIRQYDHEVQGLGVVKPLCGVRDDGPSDAAVLQPLPDSRRGIALSCGANPRYGLLDPWAMASAAIDEALRNVVAVGGDPERTAILDNFAWGNCARPEQLGTLVEAARACYATAKAYRTPFVSGKDSLNNEFRSVDEVIAIPPTLLVTALARVDDVGCALTMDLKSAGNPVYLVGLTHAELGGSHFFAEQRIEGGRVPRPDLALAPRALRALHAAVVAGCVRACHDLSEGGLAVAAAECAFAGGLGLELDLARVPCGPLGAHHEPDSVRLFSESCTRFLVEVERARASDFEAKFSGLDLACVGTVASHERLVVRSSSGRVCIDVELDALRAAHRGGFQG